LIDIFSAKSSKSVHPVDFDRESSMDEKKVAQEFSLLIGNLHQAIQSFQVDFPAETRHLTAKPRA
jgi:hypothetical protein